MSDEITIISVPADEVIVTETGPGSVEVAEVSGSGPPGARGPQGDPGPPGVGIPLPILFSRPGLQSPGTGRARWYADRPYTITGVRVSAGVPPADADYVIGVNVNGESVGGATLPVGFNTALTNSDPLTNLSEGDYVTVDVTQADGTVADIVIQILVVTPT